MGTSGFVHGPPLMSLKAKYMRSENSGGSCVWD